MRFRCALRVALALHLVALTVSYLLALALAKFAQRLDVNAIIPEFLFHTSPNLVAKVVNFGEFPYKRVRF